ncbi:hypothetical protein LCGC14_0770220 [marine sediment metagenome]|uniref:Uncharacterized protein n=1 Tax=marine sediment metagenome TaxID=412755 RepID=A0A0F9QIB3_9ZZZZ
MSKLADMFNKLDEKPEIIKQTQKIIKTKKLIVPDSIKGLFDNLDKSISSVFKKWDAKSNQWITFKKWFLENTK